VRPTALGCYRGGVEGREVFGVGEGVMRGCTLEVGVCQVQVQAAKQ
jgi:hypothetical protein